MSKSKETNCADCIHHKHGYSGEDICGYTLILPIVVTEAIGIEIYCIEDTNIGKNCPVFFPDKSNSTEYVELFSKERIKSTIKALLELL